MKLNKLFTTLAVSFTVLQTFSGKENPAKMLESLQASYPDELAVCEFQKREITIKLENKIPVSYIKSTVSDVSLTDNASFLAANKAYFNSKFEILAFDAYSLVPQNNKYEKIKIKDYSKGTDIDDGVYFDDGVCYTYTFPSVSKGTRLIETSECRCSDPEMPFIFFFGSSLTCRESAFSVMVPDGVTIRYHYSGGKDTSKIKLQISKENQYTKYSWSSAETQKYKNETNAPNIKYYFPHIIVQIADYNHGDSVVNRSLNDYYQLCYKLVSPLGINYDTAIKKFTDSITANCNTTEQKVRKIFRWVQTNTRYIAIEDGDNGMKPVAAAEVFQKRYGDCKGKTSLLVGMMHSQNIDASYAWIGSREKPYKYSEFATSVNDDHMIAVWWKNDSTPVYLDGTTHWHQLYQYPAFIQGKECLIDRGPNQFRLEPIPVAKAEQNTITDEIFIEVVGSAINGKGTITATGEPRNTFCNNFDGLDSSRYNKVFLDIIPKTNNNCMINSMQIEPNWCETEQFKTDYSFSIPSYVSKVNDYLYINLNLDKMVENNIIKPDRTIPIENDYCKTYKLTCRLKIPEGYTINQIPKPAIFKSNAAVFSAEYQKENDTLVYTEIITFDFLILYENALTDYRRFSEEIKKLNGTTIRLSKI